MEILNKDDEIERLVLATELDVGQQPWKEPALGVSAITVLLVVQKKMLSQSSLSVRLRDRVSPVWWRLWCRERGHVSSLSSSSLWSPVDRLLF